MSNKLYILTEIEQEIINQMRKNNKGLNGENIMFLKEENKAKLCTLKKSAR